MAINISEVSRKLKLTNKEFMEKAQALGFDIGQKSIKINEKLAEQVSEAIINSSKKNRQQEKMDKLKEGIAKKDSSASKEVISEDKVVYLGKNVIVHEFAKELNASVVKVISSLMRNGIMANLNQSIDFDIASIIAEELGYKAVLKEVEDQNNFDKIKNELKDLIKQKNADLNSNLVYRAPVVVVMGHVDHGKTKLLDAVANTTKMEKESGGITQHIGAFKVKKGDREITFIDTPGHEAFQAMRARGGAVADIAILLVAANEGIKQQTIEAIKIIQQENLPFVVAINKIDLPDANIDKVKSDLSELNLVPEDWGGNVICAPISAAKNIGIDDLLDLVLLAVDIDKDRLLANLEGEAMGTIIESRVDKNEGVKATLILQTGSLRVGDEVIVNGTYGKIKLIRNEKGRILESAKAGEPIEILGLKTVLHVGDIIQVIKDKKELKKKIKEHSGLIEESRNKQQVVVKKNSGETDDSVFLNLIIKSDFLGSQEALVHSIEKISKETKYTINILRKDVGNINENDVFFAEQTKSILLGFNVSTSPLAMMIAREKKVNHKESKIIYELTDYIYDELEKIIPHEVSIDTTGRAKVLKIFSSNKKSMIVGCAINMGEVRKGDNFYVKVGDEMVATGTVENLKIEKNEVEKAIIGNQCGLCVSCSKVIEEENILEFYKETKTKKTLKRY